MVKAPKAKQGSARYFDVVTTSVVAVKKAQDCSKIFLICDSRSTASMCIASCSCETHLSSPISRYSGMNLPLHVAGGAKIHTSCQKFWKQRFQKYRVFLFTLFSFFTAAVAVADETTLCFESECGASFAQSAMLTYNIKAKWLHSKIASRGF